MNWLCSLWLLPPPQSPLIQLILSLGTLPLWLPWLPARIQASFCHRVFTCWLQFSSVWLTPTCSLSLNLVQLITKMAIILHPSTISAFCQVTLQLFPLRRGRSLFPPLESELAMWPALINRMPQKRCCASSDPEPQLGLQASACSPGTPPSPCEWPWSDLLEDSSWGHPRPTNPSPQTHEEASLRSEPGPDQQSLWIDLQTCEQQLSVVVLSRSLWVDFLHSSR